MSAPTVRETMTARMVITIDDVDDVGVVLDWRDEGVSMGVSAFWEEEEDVEDDDDEEVEEE